MRLKFFLSLFLGTLWLAGSTFFAVRWVGGLSGLLPAGYLWWVIIGIALLPGFLMSSMFFSNLMHYRPRRYPNTFQSTTVLICAHNEERTILPVIQSVLGQWYPGFIRVIVIDNASTDRTRDQIQRLQPLALTNRSLEYVYCAAPGKANALNCGLGLVRTPYFITVDADTYLEKHAVQRIMNHIAASGSACVAGNLFVQNTFASLAARMQSYDYLLSIAAVKRFQGSYCSTLVAQGAFSAFRTHAVRVCGGWEPSLGEDILLTYRLLSYGWKSSYESTAVGYTAVPVSLNGLYNQRKRWAIGMLEGLSAVPPWKQGSFYAFHFTSVNLAVLYLDLAYLFGFLPGLILAFFGRFYLVGPLTLFTVAVCLLLYLSMYSYQKRLRIPFHESLLGFFLFFFFFQPLQSTAALHGYLIWLFHRKGAWK